MRLSAAQRQKVFNAALFSQSTRLRSFTNLLTGNAPQGTAGIGKTQTDADAPIVRVNDLQKQPGNEVIVDLIHRLAGKPVMGDKRIEGRSKSMSFASHTLKINQGRQVVNDGGFFNSTLTAHNLEPIARKLLQEYFKELDEETTLYHLYGARGSDYNSLQNVPLEIDAEFAEIMVNEVLAPTYSRHMYGGDAQAIDQLDSADKMSLEIIDNLSLYINEMAAPIRPIKLAEAEKAGADPFYLYTVTPRQWKDLQDSATTKDYNQLVAQAQTRSKGFNHPLFTGECLMRENILIRKMPRRVRFAAGTNVKVSKNDKKATTELRTVGVNVERSALIGAQALGVAYGKTKKGTAQFDVRKDEKDNGNLEEFTLAYCQGKQALRFEDQDGVMHDHGRIIVDTAVSQDAA